MSELRDLDVQVYLQTDEGDEAETEGRVEEKGRMKTREMETGQRKQWKARVMECRSEEGRAEHTEKRVRETGMTLRGQQRGQQHRKRREKVQRERR